MSKEEKRKAFFDKAAELGPLPTSVMATTGKRSCNRHDDCDAADEKAKEAGRLYADHCHDECCEDCFGQ